MNQNNSTTMAYVFPGQGAQSVGMLLDFASKGGRFTETFNEASEYLGYDLWNIVVNGPESELNKTEITQPALLVAGVAIWRLWCEAGGRMPDYLAGHSLGEYTALACSGCIEFRDAVTLVRDRGIYMQEAVPAAMGAMAAIIGLHREEIEKLCVQASTTGLVAAANFNSLEQTVIAGEREAVNQAIELARAAGARRALLLPVSVPSHCGLMKPAAERLATRLADIKFADASIPVIQNVNARVHQGADEIKQALVKQLHQPVLWLDIIQRLSELRCTVIIESGPGKILSGLIRRINRDMQVLNLNNLETFQTTIDAQIT